MHRAGQVDGEALSKLARESDSGSGYFGPKSARRNAYRAANHTALAHSRSSEVSSATSQALDALVREFVATDKASGNDTDEITEVWSRYRSAVAEHESRHRKAAFVGFNKSLRRVVGVTSARLVSPASMAASDAAMAVVLWDLTSSGGPFTWEYRDLLLQSWLSVFPLPEGLFG